MALHWLESSDQFPITVTKILTGDHKGKEATLVLTVMPAGIAAEVRVAEKEYLLGLLNFGYPLAEIEEINDAGMAYVRAKTDQEHLEAHILALQVVYKTAARIIGVEIYGDTVNLTVVTQGRRETHGYHAKVFSADSLAVAA